MLKLYVTILVIFNAVAFYYGVLPFLVTFADIPDTTTTLVNATQQEIAVALGHAKHSGIEEMRSFLFPSLVWLLGAVFVNFVTACVAIYLYVASQPNQALNTDAPKRRAG